MNLGLLFLKVNTTGVITLSELDWITNHQSEFLKIRYGTSFKNWSPYGRREK
jgi:hypothetical protein